MKGNFIIALVISVLSLFYSMNAETIKGVVHGESQENHHEPLNRATIKWLNSKKGTFTDKEGRFSLKNEDKEHSLIVSYIGYKTDTVHLDHASDFIEIHLQRHLELEGVEVTGKKNALKIEKSEIISTQTITSAGLEKAACCNLGESFQTNASVDVSYSDAISGAKQIMLLGLQGKYSQLLTENIPNLRGAAIQYGLNYIPGPWMDAISISKGSSSVRNGFESITGQINIAFKEPLTSEPLYLNFYGNRMGRMEINGNGNYVINPNASTMLFVHGNLMQNPMDHNGDNFVDHPIVSQINLFNRWNFSSDKWENKSGIKYMFEDRSGGQESFINSNSGYGLNIKTSRVEMFTKNGFFLGNKRSIGTILSLTYHDQDARFGNTVYDVRNSSLYANFLFDSPIFNPSHKISTGLSWQFDVLDEVYRSSDYFHQESVPGAFVEYTYSGIENLFITSGIRADIHNKFSLFFTPRIHAKYNFSDFTSIRASAGKGFRTSDIFAENTGIMVSSREFIVGENLKPEVAYNYGLNFTTEFDFENIYFTLAADYYRTDFENQIVVDLDQNPLQAVFYNLSGVSYSNSLQFELIIEPYDGITVNTAYRWNDVKQTINGELMQMPLMSPHKGFLNIAYQTYNEDWLFDVTFELQGSGRYPNTLTNPEEYRKPEYYDSFVLIHSQITKKFELFDIYLGAENITDFRIDSPIIAADNPFGNYFDSSMIYGPIFGQNVYFGVRYKI